MVRWLAFLFWLFSFATWKAFFVRLIWKPPSEVDIDDDGVEGFVLARPLNYGQRSDSEEDDAPEPENPNRISDYLAGLLSQISSQTKVRFHYESSEYGYGPLTCDEDVFVKEVLGVFANSAAFHVLKIGCIWPFTCEEIAEALHSNQSVKKIIVRSYIDSNLNQLELVSRVLLENTSVEDVSVRSGYEIHNAGAVLVGNALRHNRTLKRLSLAYCGMDEKYWKVMLDPLSGGYDSNTVLEDLSFGVIAGPEPQYCDVHIGNMVRRNTSLLSLVIHVRGSDNAGVVSSIGEALHFNNHLLDLTVTHVNSQGPGDEWKGFFASLTPDAQGRQANTTLKRLSCQCDRSFWEEDLIEIECDSLFDMLRRNTSLIKFQGGGLFLKKSVHVFQLLEALKTNKCLEILDLFECQAVKGRRVLGAIMDLLDENPYLKKIILWGTPLDTGGSTEPIQAMLEKNLKNRLWEVVQGMATATPTSGRVFLCGNPYAGKTTLRKTIMENNASAVQKRSARERMEVLFKTMKGRERVSGAKNTIEERTRGIEVHNFICGDITLTIWDMAGQEEYHALHDLVVPNLPMSGSCCSYVLVCNPAYHDDKPHQRKVIQEIIPELQYWLKFIVSNTRISYQYRPHVTIVFTHIDECLWDTNLLLEELKKLKEKFEEFLEFEDKDFMINAKTFKAATDKDSVDDVFKAMVHHLKGLLARVPKTLQACDDLQQVIAKRIQNNPLGLVLDWDEFSEICDEVPELQVMATSSDPNLIRRRKEFAASSLHDRGHLIYHEDLGIIIVNPHLFCHDIMGELMNGEKMSAWYKSDGQGCITKGNFQMALSTIPTAKTHKVSSEDVLQMMQKLELCYEQEDGSIIIPSTLSDGNGKLDWPMEAKPPIYKYKYVGRRLTIGDKEKTLLSPGFFPRLQVSLRKEFGTAYKLMKNMIKFIHDGMETIIEYSGSPTFDIDIMIRSNENEDKLDSLQRHLIKCIFGLCAHPTLGCPGVKLVEYIMRPSCVEKLVPYKYRSKHQVVMVENLKQMVLAHGNLALKYPWRGEGEVLKMDSNDAKTLLGKQMSDDVLNQLMIDLKKIEYKILEEKGSMDAIGNFRSTNISKTPKASHVTNFEDLWIMTDQRVDRLENTLIQRVDRLENTMNQRFDRLEEKMEEIKLFQENLLPRVCARLEELVTFTLEFQQHKYPRLPFFKDCQYQGLARVVPGMRNYVLHLLCEHKDGFHIVEDQEGCEISIGTEATREFQNVVKWGLRVLTLLLKVGAQFGAGMGSMVPDIAQGFLLVLDTPGMLSEASFSTTQTLMDEENPYNLRVEDNQVAQDWLIDVLEANCKSSLDIKRMFMLQKIKYSVGEDGKAGSVAWICSKHCEEGLGSKTLELLPSVL